jgi:hypothetical protein
MKDLTLQELQNIDGGSWSDYLLTAMLLGAAVEAPVLIVGALALSLMET